MKGITSAWLSNLSHLKIPWEAWLLPELRTAQTCLHQIPHRRLLLHLLATSTHLQKRWHFCWHSWQSSLTCVGQPPAFHCPLQHGHKKTLQHRCVPPCIEFQGVCSVSDVYRPDYTWWKLPIILMNMIKKSGYSLFKLPFGIDFFNALPVVSHIMLCCRVFRYISRLRKQLKMTARAWQHECVISCESIRWGKPAFLLCLRSRQIWSDQVETKLNFFFVSNLELFARKNTLQVSEDSFPVFVVQTVKTFGMLAT